MALIARLAINSLSIGYVAATRQTPGASGGLPGPDEEHVYSVESVIQGRTRRGTVRHRYGDGAATLMAKAMAEVAG